MDASVPYMLVERAGMWVLSLIARLMTVAGLWRADPERPDRLPRPLPTGISGWTVRS